MQQPNNSNTPANIGPGDPGDAKAAVQSLISAFKAYSLYPDNHSFSKKNLARLSDDLDAYLEKHETLRLETGRNNFYFKGELLIEGTAEENNPAYLLTRDGIEHIDFSRGVPSSEISSFLNILNKRRNPFEESGGDIVTSLWQENFSHIDYQEVDIFALESFQFDLASFHVTPEPEDSPAGQEGGGEPQQPVSEAASSKSVDTAVPNEFLADHGIRVLEITPQEKEALAALVREEEQKNFTSDVIDILLILLVIQKNKAHFLQVLEFLSFEFLDTMDKGAFHLALKLLNNINIINDQFKSKKPWITALLDTFIDSLSSRENLSRISWVENENLLKLYRHNIPALVQTLRFLTPEIILSIGSLVGRLSVDEVSLRNQLLSLLESKAKQDPEKLRTLLAESDEAINLILAPAVATLPKSEAARIYLQMTQHASAAVRKVGLDGYVATEASPDFTRLMHLLNAKDRSLRDRVLTYLLQQESGTAEKILIRFLTEAVDTRGTDQRIIFEAYQALASCASEDALQFLEEILLESKMSKMFSNTNAVHKKGAAFALRAVGTEEAMLVLKKGSQSLRPDIRLACKHVLGKRK